MTFYELFEQVHFEPQRPFAWAMTPAEISMLIRRMGMPNPTDRPTALELIDLFGSTRLAGAAAIGCQTKCTIS